MMNHIESLSRHGAQIHMPDGTLKSLTPEFYEAAVYEYQEKGYRATTYDLIIPGISDTLWLAIWNDGHVDSESLDSICACLDQQCTDQSYKRQQEVRHKENRHVLHYVAVLK